MADPGTSRRRRIGAALLTLAVAMAAAGLTVLRPMLRGPAFVIFWLVCIAAAGLAMLVAILDMAAVLRAARRERQTLRRAVIGQILDDVQRLDRAQARPPPHESASAPEPKPRKPR